MDLKEAFLRTPIGIVHICGTQKGISVVEFVDGAEEETKTVHPLLQEYVLQLREYFEGKRQVFHSLPLAFHGTDFEQRVWDALLNVPYGETVTYGDIAEAAGDSGAARAVGSAIRKNPLLLIVPCHRVVPASGGAGEYVAGVERKEWLLRHEQAHANLSIHS
jgi:methylated-DNA-[protein]-cysteine S-methyltransferase